MITVATVLKKYIAAYPAIGDTVRGNLERWQERKLGKRDALKITPMHVLEECADMIRTVSASTVNGYVCSLKAALDYAEVGLGMDGVSALAIHKALPILKRQQLVGSGNHRTRVPTLAEHKAILARVGPGLNYETIDFQYESARRIGETPRLMWGDLSDKTITVRDMKHPRMKTGHTKRLVVLDPAYEIIMRQPRLTNDPQERIFKVRACTVKAAFQRAVAWLKIPDLHLHDYRAGVVTRMLEDGYTPQQIMLVTGHDSPNMVMGTYNRMKPEDFPRRNHA